MINQAIKPFCAMQVWKEQGQSLCLEFLHCAKQATGISLDASTCGADE
jgi:hypothetical protein